MAVFVHGDGLRRRWFARRAASAIHAPHWFCIIRPPRSALFTPPKGCFPLKDILQVDGSEILKGGSGQSQRCQSSGSDLIEWSKNRFSGYATNKIFLHFLGAVSKRWLCQSNELWSFVTAAWSIVIQSSSCRSTNDYIVTLLWPFNVMVLVLLVFDATTRISFQLIMPFDQIVEALSNNRGLPCAIIVVYRHYCGPRGVLVSAAVMPHSLIRAKLNSLFSFFYSNIYSLLFYSY